MGLLDRLARQGTWSDGKPMSYEEQCMAQRRLDEATLAQQRRDIAAREAAARTAAQQREPRQASG